MNFLDSKLTAFFARYNFDVFSPSVENASQALFYDLNLGLQSYKNKHTQEMLPTWKKKKKTQDKKIIVLDAGGTNFRSYLIELKNGSNNILKAKKGKLPALNETISKNEFFESIAESIDYLKDSATNINFCFAYALEMMPNKDAKVIRMSKEIKVKGILNELIGESLFRVLKKKGWQKLEKVSVLNDTVAALFSGLSLNKNFSSYIGMILGTGFNIAYIESEEIPKLKTEEQLLNQIVVCETAKTNRIVGSDFDQELRNQTLDKETCKLEKMCSGAYLGDLISICIRRACTDKIFTEDFSKTFSNKNFDFKTINEFLTQENLSENRIFQLLKNTKASKDDLYLFEQIVIQILNRVSRIVTAALTAVSLKTKVGTDSKRPICIVAEGTTFKKTFGLKNSVQKNLEESLTQKHGIYFELLEIENAVPVGSAYF